MDIRPYGENQDLKAVQRIWHEIGWIDSEAGEAGLADFLRTGTAIVGTLDGEAECMVHTTPGAIRYQDTDLDLCAVTAVTTSRIARESLQGVQANLVGKHHAPVAVLYEPLFEHARIGNHQLVEDELVVRPDLDVLTQIEVIGRDQQCRARDVL